MNALKRSQLNAQIAETLFGFRRHDFRTNYSAAGDPIWDCEHCEAFALTSAFPDRAALTGLCGRGLTYETSSLPDYCRTLEREYDKYGMPRAYNGNRQ